jgi:hypothetical protein
MAIIPFVQFSTPIVQKRPSFFQRFGEQVLSQGVQTVGQLYMQKKQHEQQMALAKYRSDQWFEEQQALGNIVEYDDDIATRAAAVRLGEEIPTVVRGERTYMPGDYFDEIERREEGARPFEPGGGMETTGPVTREQYQAAVQGGYAQNIMVDPTQAARINAMGEGVAGAVSAAEEALPPHLRGDATAGIQKLVELADGTSPLSLAAGAETRAMIQATALSQLQAMAQGYSSFARERDFDTNQRLSALLMSQQQVLRNANTGTIMQIKPVMAELILTDHPIAKSILDLGPWEITNAPAVMSIGDMIQALQQPEYIGYLEGYGEQGAKFGILRDVTGEKVSPNQWRERLARGDRNAEAQAGAIMMAQDYGSPEYFLRATQRGMLPTGVSDWPLLVSYLEEIWRQQGYDLAPGELMRIASDRGNITDPVIEELATQSAALRQAREAQAAEGDGGGILGPVGEFFSRYASGEESLDEYYQAVRENRQAEFNPDSIPRPGVWASMGDLLGARGRPAAQLALMRGLTSLGLMPNFEDLGRTEREQVQDVTLAGERFGVLGSPDFTSFGDELRHRFETSPADTAVISNEVSMMQQSPDYVREWLRTRAEAGLRDNRFTQEEFDSWMQMITDASDGDMLRFASGYRFQYDQQFNSVFGDALRAAENTGGSREQ